MEAMLSRIADYLQAQSWQIAVLVVVVAVISWALRHRSAHVRYLLWLVVLAKCLVPPVVSVPLPVLPERDTPTVSVAFAPPPVEGPAARPPQETRPTPMPMAHPVVRPRPRLDTRQRLAIVWLAGVGVFAAAAAIKAGRTILWLRAQRHRMPRDLQISVDRLLPPLGLKKLPRMWLIEGVGQPFVWGFARGDIYLPLSFLRVRRDEHRRGILGHEFSHVLRFDAAVNILQIIAQAIFWFHPLVWWANRRLRAEREKSCDEMAIARLGAKARDYSTAIVNTLIQEQESTRPVPSLAIAGPAKNIEERIKTMLRPGKRFYRRPSLAVAIVVLLIALLAVPTALVLTARAQAPAPNAASLKSRSPLHQAAADGHLERVRQLLHEGQDVNAQAGRWKWTPLHMAARYGHRNMCEFLILKGATVDAKAVPGQTPLLYAAQHGHAEVAELLVANGADINAKSDLEGTTLYGAAVGGHEDLAEWLVSKGADPNTALFYAARFGHLDAAKLLLDKGSRVDARDNEGLTPLHQAASFCNTNVAELLVARGADVNARDNQGMTPAYTATTLAIFFGQQQIVDMVKLLLDRGGNIDIHLAAFVGDASQVEDFLEQGIDVDATGKFGQTPLCLAVVAGQREVARLLISNGADVNADAGVSSFMASDYSPLYLSLIYPDYDVVKLLVDNGADVGAKASLPGESPLWMPLLAAETRGANVLEELDLDIGFSDDEFNTTMDETLGARAEVYMRTIWPSLRDTVELLLDRGADVDAVGPMGMTPLIHSADLGIRDAVELFAAHGAAINARVQSGQTALHYACRKDYRDIVECLIAKGADINAQDLKGKTPLAVAEEEGHSEIADLLRARGAESTVPEGPEATQSLHDAAKTGDIEAAKRLIAQGAALNAQDDLLKTPLHYATATGKLELVKLLVEAGANVNAMSWNEWYPLGVAIDHNHVSVAEYLIDHEAKIDQGDGWTVLQEAPYNCGIEMVEMLIAKGADVNAGPYTPLHGAVQNDRLDIIELLLEKGADINTTNSDQGLTPLRQAVQYHGPAAVRLLIDKGANVSIRDRNGCTPLYWAAHRNDKDIFELLVAAEGHTNKVHLAACKGDLNRVRAWIDQGTDVNMKDEFGCTPLHWAVAADSPELVDLLIQRGADLNAKDASGFTPMMSARNVPMLERLISKGADLRLKCGTLEDGRTVLHLASRDGRKDMAEFLVHKGIDVSIRANHGATPLHDAARCGHADVVTFLLSNGADINALDMGVTPIATASRRGHTEVVNILREHGAKETLHVAAIAGDIEVTKRLIAQGADLNAKDEKGQTPLHLLNLARNGKLVPFLISHGADVNARNQSGKTPLMIAAERGEEYFVNLLVHNGADISATDNEGRTALQLAEANGHTGTIELLRQHGTIEEPSATPDNPETTRSLHQAAADGDLEMIKKLLAGGANINARDDSGYTPLHKAVWWSRAAVNLLLEEGADINVSDAEGCTPLHWASLWEDEALGALLVAKGADVEIKDKGGWTALHHAVTMRQVKLTERLLAAGADVNARDRDNHTPLHNAAIWGNRAGVERLLAAGAEINAVNSSGETPLDLTATATSFEGMPQDESMRFLMAEGGKANTLHFAMRRGDVSRIKAYIEQGGDVNLRNSRRATLLHAAACGGHADAVRLLIAEGADVSTVAEYVGTPLHVAAGAGHKNIIEILLDGGADVNAAPPSPRGPLAPLHRAAAGGHADIVRLLISRGADVNANLGSSWTPLHHASAWGHADVARLLLSEGAGANAKATRRELTPLHRAASGGHEQVVSLLVTHGAKVDARDADEWTPLHMAAHLGHRGVTELVLRNGADVNARNGQGHTPLWCAQDRGQHDIVELLRQHGAGEKTPPAPDRSEAAKPLHQATADGDIELMASLISQGADVNAKDENGWTPLHHAVAQRGRETIRWLLANGADVGLRNNNGWTPLDFAADQRQKGIAQLLLSQNKETSLFTAAYVGDVEETTQLVGAGATVNAKDASGLTPLHRATKYGYVKIVELLVAKGARVNETDGNGDTALHYAARCDRVVSGEPKDLILFLLSHGARVNQANTHGDTPIQAALPWQPKEVIDLLIEKGADVSGIHLAAYTGDLARVRSLIAAGTNASMATGDGATPLHAAAIAGQENVAEFLIGAGADINVHHRPNHRPGPLDPIPTPLYYAASGGYADVVRLLIEKGADMSVADTYYFSPLDAAILDGSKETVEVLAAGGADLDLLGPDDVAALHWAATMPHADIVRLLIQHGAEADVENTRGDTPLLYAVRGRDMTANQRKEICELLLAGEANVNRRDPAGQTPLHAAVSEGDRGLVELFIAKAADTNAKTHEGKTPLSLARERGHTEIAEFLRQHGAGQ